MPEPLTVLTDYGVMAVTEHQSKLPPEKLAIIALRRYSRGEDLSSLSHRRLSRKERIGGNDA